MKNKQIYLAAAATSTTALPKLPEGEEIYGIMPEVEVPSLIPWWAWVLLGVFLIIVIIIIRTLNKENEPLPVVPVKPKEHPKKAALRKIRELESSSAYKSGCWKDVCEVIPQILKTYACDWYEIGFGAGATSDEFLNDVGDYCIKSELVADIKHIMNKCEKVLYVGSETSANEVKGMISELKNLVEVDWKENNTPNSLNNADSYKWPER